MNKEALEWKEKGNEEFSKGYYKKAVEYYSKALKIEKSPIYYNNRATSYFKDNELKKSLSDAQKCLEMDPNFWKAYHRIAIIHQTNHNLTEARIAAEQGFKISQENSFKTLLSGIQTEYVNLFRKSFDKEEDVPTLVKFAKNGTIEVFVHALKFQMTDLRARQYFNAGLPTFALKLLKEKKELSSQINLLAFLTQVTYNDICLKEFYSKKFFSSN
jgi:tetratricopeptide (TPR) repeat protein